MRQFRWLLSLLLVLLSGCTLPAAQNSRSEVVPLTVPVYPTARHSTSTPLVLTPGVLSGTRTTFETTDSPDTLRAWYTTTLHSMGWIDVINMTDNQDMIMFFDSRGCPRAHVKIDWDVPTNGITPVVIDYQIGACRR